VKYSDYYFITYFNFYFINKKKICSKFFMYLCTSMWFHLKDFSPVGEKLRIHGWKVPQNESPWPITNTNIYTELFALVQKTASL